MLNPIRYIRHYFMKVKKSLTGRSDLIRIEVFLKSGNSFCVDVSKIEWVEGGGDGISRLSWATPGLPYDKMSYVKASQIEAIITHDY